MSIINDLFGEACGFSEEEIELAYMASAFLSARLPVLGLNYDPISYHRGSNGKLVVTGDVILPDNRRKNLTFDPVEYETPVYSCLIALKGALESDLCNNDDVLEIIDRYFA